MDPRRSSGKLPFHGWMGRYLGYCRCKESLFPCGRSADSTQKEKRAPRKVRALDYEASASSLSAHARILPRTQAGHQPGRHTSCLSMTTTIRPLWGK